MPGSEDRTIDWSPWKHPKARRWFEELLEKTHLPLMMEHAVDEADDVLVEGETHLMVALAILLGRDGIWPAARDSILRTIVRKGGVVSSRTASNSNGPLSLAEHQEQARQHDHLVDEVEMLRRRIGMSNRKQALKPPEWDRFWS